MAELQKILWIIGIVFDVLLLGILSRRDIDRNVPTFLFYCYWTVFCDLGASVYYYCHWKGYLIFYGAQSTIEEIFLISVLIDLARSAVRPLPPPISRGVLGGICFLAIGVGGIFWRLSDSWALLAMNERYHLILRAELTGSLLRVFLLMLIGGLIEFLGRHHVSIGWGERELQIATGMGVYALASVAQSLATTYQRFLATDMYLAISFAVGVVYELCMIYWIVCFLRPQRGIPGEAPQREQETAGSHASTLWQKTSDGVPDGGLGGPAPMPGYR